MTIEEITVKVYALDKSLETGITKGFSVEQTIPIRLTQAQQLNI